MQFFVCSMGYKAFMMAIQNQISVLSKILATKIQHQQILEHQQAVTAKLSKVSVSSTGTRSRKSSSNNDTSSQSGSIKEKLLNTSHTNMAIMPNEMRNLEGMNTNKTCDTKENEINNNPIPASERSNCIIS